MSISQAIIGAKVRLHCNGDGAHVCPCIIPQAELAAIQDPWLRLKRITSICRLLLDTLAGVWSAASMSTLNSS